MSRIELLLDVHQLAPETFFTDNHTEHQIRQRGIQAFMDPDACGPRDVSSPRISYARGNRR
ncbi:MULTISPECIES: hypothetical protein [Xanthomonas]|uniref:Transposase n=1 Tax=Xanthomonas rydalmerensis TaxID=3046274 RepID=A0ABZ0JJA1_9XANT|nr:MULTISPECIES: hypothetical protein [unclassified Xanthomonas]MBB5941259.1 hypothetical protein [Xanthomonas sp. 3307]WOS39882.1 hypothetical protein QN243_15870 [Xanthomonas sp. DM-2023]WOS44066.1 hypothetical protein QN242_15870 [Xanthomonas sp. DM-2023]WOS48246.1 hypothetical protein QN240_15870 [Xanthomonas sp. DM-2023]WOS52425.1 hypothetical protein QN244_15870 [Xanthomonas sp. DM-2023]